MKLFDALHTTDYGGFLYSGVAVFYDEDKDDRIFDFLDTLPRKDILKLFACQEHEGGLFLIWRDNVPAKYAEGKGFDICGDWWCVCKSSVVEAEPKTRKGKK